MDRAAKAIIIMPTLSVIDSADTIRQARNAAGVECAALVASDHTARGAVVVGNVMIRAALDWGAKWICYLNDDTEQFPQGWLKRLIEAVESRSDYGIAVPGCPCRTKPQNQGKPGLPAALIELDRPAAWVVAVLKAEMIRDVGWLEERLIHYADDSDYEMRMRERGWLSVYVQDVYIHHRRLPGEQVRSPWWAHDKGVFKSKWGKV